MSGPSRELPRWVDIGLIPLLNLLAALIVTGLVFLAIGESPMESVRIMLNGAFGYGSGLGYTLFYTTNFIFTGLAFAVALHAGLFNIGTEGQAYLGGLGVALVCLPLGFLPMVIIIPLAIIVAALFGAGWAFIPGLSPGQARQPYRHHHHHVQFHRLGADDLSARQCALAQGLDESRDAHFRSQCASAAHP